MNSDKVSEMLLEVKGKLKTLRKLAEEKQRALIELDYDKLEDIVKREEAIVNEMSNIEKKLKANKFIGDELEKVKKEIEKEAEGLRKLNFENRYLIHHSIIFVKKLAEILQASTVGDSSKINKRI